MRSRTDRLMDTDKRRLPAVMIGQETSIRTDAAASCVWMSGDESGTAFAWLLLLLLSLCCGSCGRRNLKTLSTCRVFFSRYESRSDSISIIDVFTKVHQAFSYLALSIADRCAVHLRICLYYFSSGALVTLRLSTCFV